MGDKRGTVGRGAGYDYRRLKIIKIHYIHVWNNRIQYCVQLINV